MGLFDVVMDPLEGIAETLTGVTGEKRTSPTSEVNDDAKETVGDIGTGLDTGTDNVFGSGKSGFQTLEDLLHWFQGLGDFITGIGNWIQNNAGILPIGSGPAELTGAVLGGFGKSISTVFWLLAGIPDVIGGIFRYGQSLNGYEGAGLLLGILLIILGGYLIISGVLTGRFINLPQFTNNTFDSLMGMWIGSGLVIWTTANVLGAFVIAGTGVILTYYAFITDRGSLMPLGVPTMLVGFPMLYASLKLPFTVIVVLTAGSLSLLVYGTSYIEQDLARQVSNDKAFDIGGD